MASLHTQPESMYEEVQGISEFLLSATSHRPSVAIILGSGLGGLADSIQEPFSINYEDIPNFPVSTVIGHQGKLIFGKLGSADVVCMQGRFHVYEGYTLPKVTLPIRVFRSLGVRTLIITNAAGGLNPEYKVGDVMLIKDHINLPGMCGLNPLIGKNDERWGLRFQPVNRAYSKDLRNILKASAKEVDFNIREGIYAFQSGPTFETVSETLLLRSFGADSVGMSTVPEVIVATHCGMEVLGMSLITNIVIADYDSQEVSNHVEVLETGKKMTADILRLVHNFLQKISGRSVDEINA